MHWSDYLKLWPFTWMLVMEVFINKSIQLWAEPGDGWVERKPLRSHRGNLPECIVPEEVLLFSVCESLAFVSLSTLASKPTAYTWSSDWPRGSLTFDLCCVSPAFYQYSSVSISEACAHALLRVGFLLKFFSSPSPSLSDRQIRQQFALFSLSCPAGCWIKPLTALLAQSRISLHAFNAWRWSSSV